MATLQNKASLQCVTSELWEDLQNRKCKFSYVFTKIHSQTKKCSCHQAICSDRAVCLTKKKKQWQSVPIVKVVSFCVSKNANYNPLKMKKMETGFRKLTATTCCQAALLN